MHSSFSTTPLEHGEPNQSIRHELQLGTGGRADDGYQFRGGELSKITPSNGVGGSQIGEGVESVGSAIREERQRLHDFNGGIGPIERAPSHGGAIGEEERITAEEDMQHGDQSDNNFDSDSDSDVGNAASLCDIDDEQGDRMQFEGGDEASNAS